MSNEELIKDLIETGKSSKVKEAINLDKGKTRLELVPTEAISALGEILTFGLSKGYPARNWEQGMDWGRTYGSLQRHLNAWWGGEDRDKESGKSHLHHAITRIAMLIAYEERKVGKDDRPFKG